MKHDDRHQLGTLRLCLTDPFSPTAVPPHVPPAPHPDTHSVALECSLACRPLRGPGSIPPLAPVLVAMVTAALLRGRGGWLPLVTWTNWDQKRLSDSRASLSRPLSASPMDFTLENLPRFPGGPRRDQRMLLTIPFEKKKTFRPLAISSQLGS